MEFENNTNQSVEVNNEVNEQPIQQEQTQVDQTSPPQEESKYFEVKYNKEPIKVSYDEAPDYIQKGMNYDKVQQRAQEYENLIDRFSKASGFQSQEELARALDELEQQAQLQRYQEAATDPEKFNEVISEHPDVVKARELVAKYEEEQRLTNDWAELTQEFPDLQPTDIPNEVWLMRENQGKSLLDAYLRHNYKSLAQQKEQEALKKLQQNQISSTGSLSEGDIQHNTSVKNMSKEEFESYVRKVKNGEVRNL